MRNNPLILTFLLLFTISPALLAENSTKADGYTIHHNAMTTTTLSPAIAKTYGITRSGNRGMINISLIKDKQGTMGASTQARVEVVLKRLIGRKDKVEMREIIEDNAIYYIGVFSVVNGEKIPFEISVTPKGSVKTLKATLTQEFYVD